MTTRAVPLAELPVHVAELLRDRGAAQINLYKALANSPAMVDAWRNFLWDLRDRCRSPRAHREIAILRTAVRSRSDYEWVHHVQMARAAGVTDEQVVAVRDWPSGGEVFGPEEQLVLELADALVDGSVPDTLVERAVEAWGAERYVELVVTTSAYVMVPRVLDGLRVPLEQAMAATGLDS